MRRLVTALALAIALAATGLPGIGASGSSSPASLGHFSSPRYSFEGVLPDGWRRSGARLVPLLMPREVLTVGTGPMPVGGGGNCGREPVAAIRRMRRGDALISIQEYAVTRRMRRDLTRAFPPKGRALGTAELRSARTTISFSEAGRAFDALVYFDGAPDPGLRRAAERILAGLRFGARG